jgi:phenylpyruvate tautomerase PptA (4-oxalocrotonate tautomerase family)
LTEAEEKESQMPITVTAPEGVLTAAGEREVLPRLTDALIEASGATGNSFFTALVGGTVHILPTDRIYAGGSNRPVVMVELKLPNIGLGSPEARGAFITAAARIIAELSVPEHKSENTWINIVNAPDGGWGVGNQQYTGEALIAAVMAAAH